MTKPIIVDGLILKSTSAKNQGQFNKCVRALMAYNKANDIRNEAYDLGLNTYGLERLCETKYDKYVELCYGLSKADIKLIEKTLF
jgi:hypothetical protein